MRRAEEDRLEASEPHVDVRVLQGGERDDVDQRAQEHRIEDEEVQRLIRRPGERADQEPARAGGAEFVEEVFARVDPMAGERHEALGRVVDFVKLPEERDPVLQHV